MYSCRSHSGRRHALAVAAFLALSSMVEAAPEMLFAKHPAPGQYIVVLRDGVAAMASDSAAAKRDLPSVAEMGKRIAAQHAVRFGQSYNHVLRGFVVQADDEALARLLQDDRIAYVAEDSFVQTAVTQAGATWGIDRIDQRNLPLSGTYTYNATASNVHVYVIDTGLRLDHSEFVGRVGVGADAIGGDASDCNGHGTHVAGIVGGATYGVAKGVTIHPVRVLDCTGSGLSTSVIAGMDWVAANFTRPAVVNMSLSTPAFPPLDEATSRLVNAGVTVVVAASNENQEACLSSPARAPLAITVGATTADDVRANYSNYGACLDIFAPGSAITSAHHAGPTATATWNGTSMASPHVAGVAALYLSQSPSATPAQVTAAVLNAATPNKVTDARAGSPNRLLYTVPGGSVAPAPAPSGGILVNGVTVAGLAVATGNSLMYTMQVPQNATGLFFLAQHGTGKEELSVRFGAPPTDTIYDCRSVNTEFREACSFSTARAGTYYVRLKAITSFSRVNLYGSYSVQTIPPARTPRSGSLTNGLRVDGLETTLQDVGPVAYGMQVPPATAGLTFTTSGGTGSARLRVLYNGNFNSDDCVSSTPGTTVQTCHLTERPLGGEYTVIVEGIFSGLSLLGSYGQDPNRTLNNGVARQGLTGYEHVYAMNVPHGATGLTFVTSGGAGQLGLWVKLGSSPFFGDYDCYSYSAVGGTNQICSIPAPQVGTYYVGMRSISGPYSGVSLTGSYSLSPAPPRPLAAGVLIAVLMPLSD